MIILFGAAAAALVARKKWGRPRHDQADATP